MTGTKVDENQIGRKYVTKEATTGHEKEARCDVQEVGILHFEAEYRISAIIRLLKD